MKTYVSDAVAFLYFLLDRLPHEADKIFKEAEEGRAVVYLPTIAAAELFYLFEKKGWLEWWVKLRNKMSEAVTFRYYPFDEKVLNLLESTKAREIHDKIIILTAKALKADALLTKDEELVKLNEIKIIRT
ncbi:MAG: type II toxin-antitoxin system VapC family toxin [Candidatus Lokiarchaeia archaeon]